MNSKKYFLVFLVIISLSFTPHKKSYKIFNQKGKQSSYEKLLKEVEKADIVFFGELHNNPINHWLQYELTKDMYEKISDNLILGAEMFEADNQTIINEYLGGHLSYSTFEEAVKLWSNNRTDYQPLIDFSLYNQLTFIATNLPKRYAKIVFQRGFKGLNSVSNEARKWMAPIPIEYNKNLKGYKKIAKMAGKGVNGENLAKSQAIRDATMAHFILKNWQQGRTFIHFNGTHHSNNFEGIIWYLRQQKPNLKILSIGSVEQMEIDSLTEKNVGIAHFVICTPKSMTKTF